MVCAVWCLTTREFPVINLYSLNRALTVRVLHHLTCLTPDGLCCVVLEINCQRAAPLNVFDT